MTKHIPELQQGKRFYDVMSQLFMTALGKKEVKCGNAFFNQKVEAFKKDAPKPKKQTDFAKKQQKLAAEYKYRGTVVG